MGARGQVRRFNGHKPGFGPLLALAALCLVSGSLHTAPREVTASAAVAPPAGFDHIETGRRVAAQVLRPRVTPLRRQVAASERLRDIARETLGRIEWGADRAPVSTAERYDMAPLRFAAAAAMPAVLPPTDLGSGPGTASSAAGCSAGLSGFGASGCLIRGVAGPLRHLGEAGAEPGGEPVYRPAWAPSSSYSPQQR